LLRLHFAFPPLILGKLSAVVNTEIPWEQKSTLAGILVAQVIGSKQWLIAEVHVDFARKQGFQNGYLKVLRYAFSTRGLEFSV
jgi:hypothetical protein